jgi:cysteine desulfurase
MSAYLDHAASTPTRPEVVDAMLPYLTRLHANPSGAHRLARDVRRAVDDARDLVAEALGADPGEVVFTSGGTESDNLAVLGTLDHRGGLAVCSAVEHHAVGDAVASRHGVRVPVDPHGVIDLDALESVLVDAGRRGQVVSLVSVMLVNNEVGTIQPLDRVVELARVHAPHAAVHTDAVQALAWLDVAAAAAGADLVAVSGHKFGGPKGVGALVVRGRAAPDPRQLGGGQERGRRGGTPNVAGIVGLGLAARLALESRRTQVERVGELRDRLAAGLAAAIPGAVLTGAEETGAPPTPRVAGICHLSMAGIESEALLYLLEQREVYASAGSSCSSGALDPSHVLAAMGIPRDLAKTSLRLSLGWPTTVAEIDLALEVIPAAAARLARFARPVAS